MTALIVILSILGLITLLFHFPVIVDATYTDRNPTAHLRYLFLKFQIYPRPPKKEKQTKAPDRKKKQKDKTEEPKSKKGFLDLLQDIVEMARSADSGLKYIFRHMIFYKITLEISVGGEDAAQIAVKYGKVSAYVYSAYAVLSNAAKFKKCTFNIYPCYDKIETETYFNGRMRVRPVIILIGGISIFYHFLVNTLNKQNDVRSGGYHGRTSNTRTYEHNHAKNQGNGRR